MREIREVLDAARSALARGEASMMATVLSVRGSSFRRPGARLWIGAGRRAGSVSAGCLENDLAERAIRHRASGAAFLVSYDTATEADVLWGTASGCGGRLDILLEPVTSDLVDDLDWMAGRTRMRERCVLITAWDGDRVQRLRVADGGRGSQGAHPDLAEASLEDGRTRVVHEEERIALIEAAMPEIALTVVGGGEDALALARQAVSLGWTVRLVDRSRSVESLAGAVVTAEDLETLQIDEDDHSAVVLMTHNFHRDAELLAHLRGRSLGYLGVLGPLRRTAELLQQIGAPASAFPTLHAPPGLDLGGETPEEIALSIVSEVKAVFAGRGGGMLRHVRGPIHDRVESVEQAHLPLLPR